MKESLDKNFARYVEKNAETLRAITSGTATDLGMSWVALAYIFEFNCLYIYDTDDGLNFRESYGFDRCLLKETATREQLADLIKTAFHENKPKSRQREEQSRDDMLTVEAIAAIPLVINNARKILLICKQLEKPKNEVIEGYIFDGYTLQLYLWAINTFIMTYEQRQQLFFNRNLIRIGTVTAIGAGVLALMEGLSSTIDIFRGASFIEVAGGLSIIGLLVFLSAVIFQVLTSKKSFKFLQKLPTANGKTLAVKS